MNSNVIENGNEKLSLSNSIQVNKMNNFIRVKRSLNKQENRLQNKKWKKMIFALMFGVFVISIISIFAYYILSYCIVEIVIKIKDREIIHSLGDTKKYEIIQLKNGIVAALISCPSCQMNSLAITVGFRDGDTKNYFDLPNLVMNVIDKNLTKSIKSPFLDILSSYNGSFKSELKDNSFSLGYEVGKKGFIESLKLFSNFIKNNKISSEISMLSKNEIDQKFQSKDKTEEDIADFIVNLVQFRDNSKYDSKENNIFYGKINNFSQTIEQNINRYFFGGNIKITILSNLRIGKIKGLALKYFGDIKESDIFNSDKLINKKTNHPNLNKIVSIQSKGFSQYLSISFYFNITEIPQSNLYLKYIKYLIKDKARCSLSSQLFQLGYISNINIYITFYQIDIIEFKINIKTNHSAKFDPIEYIILSVFIYLQKIKTNMTLKDHETIYKEFENINYKNFYYQPEPHNIKQFTIDISSSLFYLSENLTALNMQNYYIPPFNGTIIKMILEHFNYKNSIIVVGTKNKSVQLFRYYSGSSFSHINKNSKIFDINFWYDNIKELKMDKFLENTYFDSKLCVRKSFDNL